MRLSIWRPKGCLMTGSLLILKKAYLEAEKTIIYIREKAKERQEKSKFRLKIKSIKKQLSSDHESVNIPYRNKNKY